jgi:hypothetical protein
LHLRNIPHQVVDIHAVFIGETEALALELCLLDQHTGICTKASEGEVGMLIELEDLPDGSTILQLLGRLLLDGEDDGILGAYSYRAEPSLDGLGGILDLEQVTIRGEDGNGTIVAHSFSLVSVFFLLFLS